MLFSLQILRSDWSNTIFFLDENNFLRELITPGILTIGMRMEHQEEWTGIWLSINSGEIEHNIPRSEDTVAAGLF